MTIKKFFSFLFLQLILLLLVKVAFFKVFGITSESMEYVYWAVIAITVTALVRRLGVINFFEAIFIAIFWFLCNVLFDLLVTVQFLGLSLFSRWQLWAGYAIMMLAIFFLHKKRHVEIRKEQAAHRGHH